MKKGYLLTLAFMICGLSMKAQSSCANAQVLSVANDASLILTVPPLSGDPTPVNISCITAQNGMNDQNAAWYTYTPNQDIVVTVTTNLASNGGPNELGAPDPNYYYPALEIFTGPCSNLSWVICDFGGQGSGGYTVTLTFLAQSGTPYYIVFNDFNSQRGIGGIPEFDFEISTDTNIPTTPGIVTNPTPPDNAVDVPVDGADNNGDGNPDNSIKFEWTPATDGVNVDWYRVYLGTTAPNNGYSDLNLIGQLYGTNTWVNIGSIQDNTEYFWAIVPVNGIIPADESAVQVWSFTTGVLAMEDHQYPQISVYPNPVGKELNIDIPGSLKLKSASLYDLTGKKTKVYVSENNSIDLSKMASGVYILKLETSQGIMTKKIIKQ